MSGNPSRGEKGPVWSEKVHTRKGWGKQQAQQKKPKKPKKTVPMSGGGGGRGLNHGKVPADEMRAGREKALTGGDCS